MSRETEAHGLGDAAKLDGARFREHLDRAKAEAALNRASTLISAADRAGTVIALQKPWLPEHVRAAMRSDFMNAHGLSGPRRGRNPGHLRRRSDPSLGGPTFDHAELFAREGRAYAYTTQPYGYVASVVDRVSERFKLQAFNLGRERSWYYPFVTELIVFVRSEEAEAFLNIERERLARPWDVTPLSSIPASDKSPFREAAQFKKGRGK